MTILEVAKNAGASRMLELLEETGLSEELSRMENFTFFLPTDDAFQVNLPIFIITYRVKS